MKKIIFIFCVLTSTIACDKPQVCVSCSALCAQTGFSKSGHSACAETREEAEKQATDLMHSDSLYKNCTLQCAEYK